MAHRILQMQSIFRRFVHEKPERISWFTGMCVEIILVPVVMSLGAGMPVPFAPFAAPSTAPSATVEAALPDTAALRSGEARLTLKNRANNRAWTSDMPLTALREVQAQNTGVEDTTKGPQHVAAAYFEAFQARDWTQCASLMHPDALQRLKDVLVEAVAEDSSSGISDALYGKGTPREVIRFAPPEELYAKMLATVYRNAPAATRVLDRLSTRILGHVVETDRLVHVVVRTSVAVRPPPGAASTATEPGTTDSSTTDSSTTGRSDPNRTAPESATLPVSDPASALTQVEVISVRRSEDTWRLDLTADIRDIARAVQRPPER